MSRFSNRITQLLKQSSVLRAINASVKSRQLVRERASLVQHYATKAKAAGITANPADIPRQLAERLAARGIRVASLPSRLRILWIGADRNQDVAGFLPALQRHAHVVPFHRASGEYGVQLKSADGRTRQYDPAVVAANDARLLDLVREHAERDAPFDVVMGQMWAHTLSAGTLRQVQSQGVITVNVSMDDRLPILWRTWHGYPQGSLGIKEGLDLILTTSPECCVWYAVEGVPCLFWPLASDPAVFAPAPESDKCYDITFVGSRYGVREQVVDALIRGGVNVTAFGPGWPRGPVDADAVADIFAKSRMILGIGTIAHTTDVYTIKLRDFDATMAGAVYITHRNPDLLELFKEGEEILCYSTLDELVRKVKQCLADPDARARIGKQARARALQDHTWDTRFRVLLATLRGEAVGA